MKRTGPDTRNRHDRDTRGRKVSTDRRGGHRRGVEHPEFDASGFSASKIAADIERITDAIGRRLRRVSALVRIVRLVRTLATPLGRGRLRAQYSHSRLFQPATTTCMDRHPPLFDLVRKRLSHVEAPRLLSFGCSTGEEAFTLAHYLPNAAIDAIDANPACIVQARRTLETRMVVHEARIRFACSDVPDAFENPSYDAVLCLSVLRHGDLDAPSSTRSTDLMPFTRFAAAIDALDRVLRPDGILIIWGCNFRFGDTAAAKRYRRVDLPGMSIQLGSYYGPDDRLLAGATYADFAFVKIKELETLVIR